MEQAKMLIQEAERLKKVEKVEAIEEIKAKIKLYGITSEDIGLAINENTSRQVKKQKATVPTKYHNPETGDEWSGRGSSPKWIVEAVNNGKRREDFLVGSDFISKKNT